ncbi:chromosome segregation protein SMC [Nicoliella lavandulae]
MQLVGFKSFAEKTEINFQNGLTAIVGPNGSGKSNVIEAIRWVLGEQSAKHLRSNKMADVIFSGAKSHRALNRAEVTLTFDNTDHYLNTNYTEITVTRKLFRNGDSFYYLNHRECRLKDINNLLMDTGIGMGSFSIISQGNVEAIFNSKPEQRRNIIETTAGIYKYRQRKQEAVQRLSETNDNLARVNDIILELSRQVTDLEQQRNAAKQYQALNHQLADLQQQSLALTARDLLQSHEQDQAQLTHHQGHVTDLKHKIAQLRAQKKDAQDQVDRISTINEQRQAKRLTQSNQIEKLRSQRQLATQQSNFQSEQLSHDKQQLAQLVQQYSVIEDQLTQIDQQCREQQALIKQLHASLSDEAPVHLQQQIDTIEQQISTLRSQYLDQLQRTSDLKNRLNYANKSQTQANTQQQIIEQRIKANQASIDELNASRAEITTKLDDHQHQLTKFEHDEQQHAKQLQTVRTQTETAQNEWYRLLKQSQQLKAQLDGLTEFQHHLGGYFQGSKHLLANRDQLKGIIGAVAEFINVDQPYVKAIETALGNRIQQIMVTDHDSARAAVQFMTTKRLGRVTLLPVNQLSQHQIPQAVLSKVSAMPGFVQVASELVQMSAQYQSVCQFLLGNVLIAADLKAATHISNAVQHRYRVVTLDGQVVNAGGSITGGANRNQSDGMLTQKQRQADLKARLDQLNQQLQQAEANVKTSQARQKELSERVNDGQRTRSEVKQTIQLLTGQLNQTNQSIDTKQRELATQRINLKTILGDQAMDSNGDDERQLQLLNQKLQQNQAAVKAHTEHLSTLRDQLQTANRKAQAQREQLVRSKAEVDHLTQREAELKQQLEQNQATQIELNQSIKSVSDQLDRQLTHAELASQIEQLQTEVTTLNQAIDADQDQLQRLKTVIAPLDDQIDAAQDELMKSQKATDQLQTKLSETVERLQKIKVTANQRDGLDFKSLLDLTVTVPLAELKRQISQLSTQISALGPVNMGSISQFEAVNERYQFLKQQADDLIHSKQQLESTMDKMDTTVKKRFKDTFDQLQVAFKTTFKEIFGGGEAKLTLTDPNHLLTTGIEIMAQPPGKRYRNMMLLSGGERSLTAIALLFAILKLRPVPFCILDEAESALDPANVDRFARYIQKLKDHTQFIVITHRKETMVYADHLYGVTMQDSGISKVLSVNLNQAQSTKG